MMNLKSFLFIAAGIMIAIALVNIPMNLAFEYLKAHHYITQKSVDGFTTWDLHWTPQQNQKFTPPDSAFPYEHQDPKTISTFKDIYVLIGSSVVAGDGVDPSTRFSDQLNHLKENEGLRYFFNAGRSGSEIYTYFEPLPELLGRYPQIRCLIWFPNRNDLINHRERAQILRDKETASALSSAEKMPWQDYLFWGIFKRLGQRFTFEGNLLKENSIDSNHNLYYTNGLLESLSPETESDLHTAIASYQKVLASHSVAFSTVFLPPRNFNHYREWREARSLLQLQKILNDLKIRNISFFEELKGHDDYVDYVHFNPTGHQFLAQLIQKNLKDLCPADHSF